MFFRTFLLFILIAVLVSCQIPEDIVKESMPPISHHQIDDHDEIADITLLMGSSVDKALEKFGTTKEIGMSNYGYDWLIYNKNASSYLQIGHENNTIVTIFILGENVKVGPLKIGESYGEIKDFITLKNEVQVDHNSNEYRFDLTGEELLARPLIKLSENVFAQLYFDRFTEELTAIRLLNKETLLRLRPYRIIYRGELEEYAQPNNDMQLEIEKSNKEQIFEITNVLRERYGKGNLNWNEKLAAVAFGHSKDMKENNYFDHTSPINGDLGDRLKKAHINYFLAGENIAAEYPDGIAAVMGWLNSEGHRKTLLHENFTDLGVGVYDKYYTQNFISQIGQK